MTGDDVVILATMVLKINSAKDTLEDSGPSFDFEGRVRSIVEETCCALGVRLPPWPEPVEAQPTRQQRLQIAREVKRAYDDLEDVFAPVQELDLDGL